MANMRPLLCGGLFGLVLSLCGVHVQSLEYWAIIAAALLFGWSIFHRPLDASP